MFQRCQNPTKLTRAYLIIMPEPGLLAAAYSYLGTRTHVSLLRSLDLCSTKSKESPYKRMHLVAAATSHMLLMSASRWVLIFSPRFRSECIVATGVHDVYVFKLCVSICMCVWDSLLLFQEPKNLPHNFII